MRIPIEIIDGTLIRLEESDLINFNGQISSEQRIKLALFALRKGADLERICSFLNWREFEDVAAIALEKNGYIVRRNFRFKHHNVRHEIDVLGFNNPLILSIDCKHWIKSWKKAAIIKAVGAQVRRTLALAKSLPLLIHTFHIEDWKKVKIMPLILTLSETPLRIYKEVPVVPIFNIQSLLSEMPKYENELAIFKIGPP